MAGGAGMRLASGFTLVLCFCWCSLQGNAISCMPNAIPAASRLNVSVGEGLAKMPLTLCQVSWASGSLLAHAARILLQEKVGYNVVLAPQVDASRKTWMQLADCNSTVPTDRCFQGPPGSGAHLAIEVWESYSSGMPEKLAVEVPGRAPIVVGELGALGTEAFFVRRDAINNASQKAVFLQWYESYNASWSSSHLYFASHADLPIPDTPCNETVYMQGNYLEDYEKFTGDSEAIIVQSGTGEKKRKCDANGWALSPACRRLIQQGATGCIPAVCASGWGFHDLAQKAVYYDMPIALGAFSWANYLVIPKAHSTLTYWWTPDTALLESDPVEVTFPRYDPDEYGQNIYRSAMAGTRLLKISNAAIFNEVIVQQFVKQMEISIQSIMKFAKLSVGRPDSDHEEIACNWLKNNGKVWNKWIPDPTNCISKQGLMDGLGSFVTEANTSNATMCEFCAAGRRSDDIQTPKGPNFVCKTCEAGKYQSNLGETSCAPCASGMYSNVGAISCGRCPIGEYQAMTGQVNCTTCVGALTTQFLGAENISSCRCPAGFYRDPQNSNQCNTCLEGMTCAFGSDATVGASVYPMLKPRHWSSATRPLYVFRCSDVYRCPGGEPGACGPNTMDHSCARCREGFAYDGEKCYECADVEKTSFLYPTLPMLLVPVLVCLLYKLFGDHYEKWGTWRNGLAGLAFIVLNHYQIIAMLQNVNIQLPDAVVVNLEFWSFSSDVGSVFKPQCAGFNLNKNLIVKTIFPAYYLALGFATMLFSRLVAKVFKSAYMEPNRAFNAVLSMMLTFFLGMVSLALTLFICKSNPNDTSSLAIDRSITCGEETWSGLIAIGIVAVLLWVVGVAALFVWAILTMPSRMNDPDVRMRWKFLFIKFRPDRYWWAITFLARGVLLNLGLVIFSSGFAQIFWMMSVLAIYQLLAIWCMPWRHMMSNLVDIVAMICLSLSGSCLLWFAKDGVSETERKALDNDLITFSIAFSLVIMPFVFYAGSHIIYSQLSVKAKAAKEDDMAAVRKALTGLAAADGTVLMNFLANLTEWDYFFTRQCSSVIYFEYFGTQSLRKGYTTVSLDSAESVRRINSGESNAETMRRMKSGESASPRSCGSQGDAFKASKSEEDEAKFEEPKKIHSMDDLSQNSVATTIPSSFMNSADELPQEFHPTPRLSVTAPHTPREGPMTPR